jgi:hypothetical protein
MRAANKEANTSLRAMIDLPVRFPSDADVNAEEAARYRALSPDERFRYLQGMLVVGARLLRQSPKADFIREQTRQDEEAAMQVVKEFIARHVSDG